MRKFAGGDWVDPGCARRWDEAGAGVLRPPLNIRRYEDMYPIHSANVVTFIPVVAVVKATWSSRSTPVSCFVRFNNGAVISMVLCRVSDL